MKLNFLITRVALGVAVAASAGVSLAQQYPGKPVRMILSYAAGGPTDVVARAYAQKVGELLGQQIVIENRPGGGNLIGARAVAQASPDGYTLLFTTTTHNTAPIVFKEPGYAIEDFVLTGGIGITPLIIASKNNLPFRSLKDMVAYAKANPGKLNNGTLGGGGITQLMLSRFKTAAGIETTDINFGGGGPAMQALVAGTIDYYLDAAPTALPQVKSGRIVPLAISTENRSPLVPDVPTFREAGFPTMTGGAWFAVFAPAKTPSTIVQQLRGQTAKAIASPDLAQRLSGLIVEPWSGSDEDFEAFLKQDRQLWEQDAKRLNLVRAL